MEGRHGIVIQNALLATTLAGWNLSVNSCTSLHLLHVSFIWGIIIFYLSFSSSDKISSCMAYTLSLCNSKSSSVVSFSHFNFTSSSPSASLTSKTSCPWTRTHQPLVPLSLPQSLQCLSPPHIFAKVSSWLTARCDKRPHFGLCQWGWCSGGYWIPLSKNLEAQSLYH